MCVDIGVWMLVCTCWCVDDNSNKAWCVGDVSDVHPRDVCG
jgi:hypothetical protein